MRNHFATVAVGAPSAEHARPAGEAPRTWYGGRRPWIVGFAVAAVALYAGYLCLSRTVPVTSDGANIELMAWDMLHGNVFLHGWYAFDVSYLTTELPQYALLEAFFGLTPAVTHIAAAMTYTLSVLLAMMLAKGRGTGRAALARALIAGGIMLAPQYSMGVFYLVLSVGHIGASVPLLVVLLVLDRARPGWRAALLIGVLLAWATVGDPLTYVLGSVPLAIACGYRAVCRTPSRRVGVAAASRARGYDTQLTVAALASIGVAEAALKVVRALKGFELFPVPFHFTGTQQLASHLSLTWQALLILFGADYHGLHGVWLAAALLHFAGVALAAVAVACGVWRWFRPDADLVEQVLVGGIVVDLVLFATSDMARLNAHELAVVLPFSAVLAARVLTRVRVPRAAGVIGVAALSGYLACLAGTAARPAKPAEAPLAAFLEAHHLTYGIAGYWEASIVTVDTGGRVSLRALSNGKKFLWAAKGNWYNPRANDADFIVAQRGYDYTSVTTGETQIRDRYGVPARVYVFGGGDYIVMVYGKNLLTSIHGSTH